MWIGRDVFNTMKALIDSAQTRNTEMLIREGTLRERVSQLEKQLQQQETLNEWFRHRLNQVEQERAQLIYAATGGKDPIPEQVKINVPNFQGRPTTPMQGWASLTERLNESFNPYEGVGEDSHDPADQAPHAEDVSNMPRGSR